MDIACQVIEKIAMDRAVVEIDEALASAYEVRGAHAEVCFTDLCHVICSLIPNSTDWVSRSGTQPLLDLISLKHCPKPSGSKTKGYNRIKLQSTRISVRLIRPLKT